VTESWREVMVEIVTKPGSVKLTQTTGGPSVEKAPRSLLLGLLLALLPAAAPSHKAEEQEHGEGDQDARR
jgi:hypothetical protein